MSFDPVAAFVKENCDPMKRISWNHVKFRDGWTKETMRVTFEICMLAWLDGKKFATEVVLLNGRRADIVVPEWVYPVIEVVDSETPESIASKERDYESIGLWFLTVPANVEGISKVIREQGLKKVGKQL